MIIIRGLLPIAYSCFIGGAYGAFFRKRFGISLMPAYCIQTLLLLICGMTVQSLTGGILTGFLLALLAWMVAIRRDKSLIRPARAQFDISFNNIAFPVFVILAGAVFVLNTGKCFSDWDEFSHWGRFIKECIRLDRLYVTSTASMAHPDYVPAISLFEYLWCRLSLHYNEPNAYRGIQVLFVASILPEVDQLKGNKKLLGNITAIAAIVLLLVGLPLVFPAFRFYHTVYQDAIFGILIYYSMRVANERDYTLAYRTFTTTLTICMLAMSKMTAIAFVPMVWLYFAVKEYAINHQKNWHHYTITILTPIGLWIWFNHFVKAYVITAGGQSYGGFSLAKIIDVVLHNGDISWQTQTEKAFLYALFSRDLVGHASFAILFLMLVFGVYRIALTFPDQVDRDRMCLLSLWIALSGIAYIILMCFLYDTAFSEYEAIQLASFERYISSWLIAVCFLAAYVMISRIKDSILAKYSMQILMLTLGTIILLGEPQQMYSGITAREEPEYSGEAALINKVVGADQSVLLLDRGGKRRYGSKTRLLCSSYCG